MVSFTSIALFFGSAAALGINCRGSVMCSGGGASLSDLYTQVQQIQASGKGGTNYGEGVQIACVQGTMTSYCAFYQKGASGTADRAAELIKGLLDHQCGLCGSNPLDGDNVDNGELTVNAVSRSCCNGACVCPM